MVSSDAIDPVLLNIARLAYRLGRQDQQRFCESFFRRKRADEHAAELLRSAANEFPHEPVDFPSIIRSAQEHSTAVNSASTEAR